MADEQNINRISLRVPADVFERLDEKRFRAKTSFQQIGMDLLTAWLEADLSESDTRKIATKAEHPSGGIASDPDPAHAIDVSGLTPEQVERLGFIADLLRTPESKLDALEIRFRDLLNGFVDQTIALKPPLKAVRHKRSS